MDLTYSLEDEAFRQRVRKWIAVHAPKRADLRDLEADLAGLDRHRLGQD